MCRFGAVEKPKWGSAANSYFQKAVKQGLKSKNDTGMQIAIDKELAALQVRVIEIHTTIRVKYEQS
jgi:hypothetical protein